MVGYSYDFFFASIRSVYFIIRIVIGTNIDLEISDGLIFSSSRMLDSGGSEASICVSA